LERGRPGGFCGLCQSGSRLSPRGFSSAVSPSFGPTKQRPLCLCNPTRTVCGSECFRSGAQDRGPSATPSSPPQAQPSPSFPPLLPTSVHAHAERKADRPPEPSLSISAAALSHPSFSLCGFRPSVAVLREFPDQQICHHAHRFPYYVPGKPKEAQALYLGITFPSSPAKSERDSKHLLSQLKDRKAGGKTDIHMDGWMDGWMDG